MSLINKTYRQKRGGVVRVVRDECEKRRIWLIDVYDAQALPTAISWLEFSDKLHDGTLKEVDDPFLSNQIPCLLLPRATVRESRQAKEKEVTFDSVLTEAEQRAQDRYWEIISKISVRGSELLYPGERGRILRELANQGVASYPTLLKLLRRYWQRGMTKAALLPDFRNCGRRKDGGKRQIRHKLGAPRTVAKGRGINVSESHKDLMQKFWKKSYLTLGRSSLRGAYNRFKDAYLQQHGSQTPSGDVAEYIQKHADIEVPSFAQFQYHFYRNYTLSEVLWNRKGRRHFESNLRPILNNARNEVRGIGYRYLIDATTADVYIVSAIDRNRIVGRPTVYLITDVATRVIVGFYVGLEPPSWAAALQALINVFEVKVSLCHRYGLTIQPEMWPNAPSSIFLLADNAEALSKQADTLVGVIFEGIENARSYRGDDKSVVERTFGAVQMSFGPFTPGYVERPHLARGERDPRLDAAYTLEAFRKAMIIAILESNNVDRREFDGDPAILAAGVPNIPTALWDYYETNHLVDGKPLTKEFAARHLRHAAVAKLERRAIRLEPGLYYASAEIMAEPWFGSLLLAGEKLHVRYDPSDISFIDVHSPVDRRKLYRCYLTSHAQRFNGCSLSEVRALRRRERENLSETQYDPELFRAYCAGEQKKLREEQLAARKAEYDPQISHAARVRGIRENREVEKKLDQMQRTGRIIPGEVQACTISGSEQTAAPDDIRKAQLDELRLKLSKGGDESA